MTVDILSAKPAMPSHIRDANRIDHFYSSQRRARQPSRPSPPKKRSTAPVEDTIAAAVPERSRAVAINPVEKLPASAKTSSKKRSNHPSTPPKIIVNRRDGLMYSRDRLLGEGGFARCYEVKMPGPDGKRWAAKVIAKAAVTQPKHKNKLFAEIKIHQKMKHPNIVKFYNCFEDHENIYMILELCENRSMMELLRHRKRLTEAETRYYMLQILGACSYMHGHGVIHRDLKLGNLFLDSNMDVQLGDFGLAALLCHPSERKKTICGTPNYIAPEILFDTANGHSYEVDIWSVGVILYTLLFGRPPFQTNDVKAIYKKIKDCRYVFPDIPVSESAKDLISQLLTNDPTSRPTIEEIANHQFFHDGPLPDSIPVAALYSRISFPISQEESDKNWVTVCRRAGIGQGLADMNYEDVGEVSIVQEVEEASFIAHDPDIVARPNTVLSEMIPSRRQKHGKENTKEKSSKRAIVRETKAADKVPEQTLSHRRTLSEQVNDVQSNEMVSRDHQLHSHGESRSSPKKSYGKLGMSPPAAQNKSRDATVIIHPEMKSRNDTVIIHQDLNETTEVVPLSPEIDMSKSSFQALLDHLELASTATRSAQIPTAKELAFVSQEPPKIFVSKWVDYSTRYGLAFQLTDGSVGIHFVDNTEFVLSPDCHHFDYINSEHLTESYTVGKFPKELRKKVHLTFNFRGYMIQQLGTSGEKWNFKDKTRTHEMDYVSDFFRMGGDSGVLFQLSHRVVQANFADHRKLIFSNEGLTISYIERDSMRTFSLQEVYSRRNRDDIILQDVKRRCQGIRESLKQHLGRKV